MSEATHTPGPWRVEGWSDAIGSGNTVLDDDGRAVSDGRISAADARLIAAAPDLLAALRHAYDVLGTFHHEDPTNEVMVQAYEAIVKATGSDVIA